MNETQWLTSEDPFRMLNMTGGTDVRVWDRPPYLKKTSERQLRLIACAISRLRQSPFSDDSAGGRLHNSHRRALEEVEGLIEFRHVQQDFDAIQRHYGAWAVAKTIASESVRHLLNRDDAACAQVLREVLGNPFGPVTLPRPEIMCPQCSGNGSTSSTAVYTSRWSIDACGRCKATGVVRGPCPWLTPDAIAIAKRVYEERDFDSLPVLADALEEAGCLEEVLLQHLRGLEPCPREAHESHSRGRYYTCHHCAEHPGWRLASVPHVRGCWALDLILGKS